MINIVVARPPSLPGGSKKCTNGHKNPLTYGEPNAKLEQFV